MQPRSQSSSAISDVTSSVKLVRRIRLSRYRARFQASSCYSDSANWPGYEAVRDVLSVPVKVNNTGSVANVAERDFFNKGFCGCPLCSYVWDFGLVNNHLKIKEFKKTLWLYAGKPGRVLKRLNAWQSEIVLDFLQKIPFSNSLKVFYLHLELPSDQENSTDFAVERLRFGYGEETPFPHLEKFRE